MRKLRAIWNIIKANKWAVFTYEEAHNDPEWATFPFFRWNVSEKDLGFFRLKENDCLVLRNIILQQYIIRKSMIMKREQIVMHLTLLSKKK